MKLPSIALAADMIRKTANHSTVTQHPGRCNFISTSLSSPPSDPQIIHNTIKHNMKVSALLRALKLKPKTDKLDPVPSLSPFEALPLELKLVILSSTPDLPTLHNLILSSPIYHTAYLSSRREILARVVLTSLPPEIFFEALAVHAASKLPRDATRYTHISAFIDSYKTTRMDPSAYERINEEKICNLSHDEVLEMARMHSIVRSVTQKYCDHIFPLCDEELPLSVVEEARIHRGLYRFQLFVNLFSDVGDDKSIVGIRTANRPMGMGFLVIYEPWVRLISS